MKNKQKKILISILAIFLFLINININYKEIHAANYKIDIVRGLGKKPGNEKASAVLNNAVDTGYSLYGYFNGGEIDQSSKNSLVRYSQRTNKESQITGIDIYYGDQVIYNARNGIYLKKDGTLTGTTTNGGINIAKFSIGETAFYSRFKYIDADLTMVFHYVNEDKIEIKNVFKTSINETYDKYYKDENSYIIPLGYKDANGFEIKITPLEKEVDSIFFNIDNKEVILDKIDGDYYLSNEYKFSNKHTTDDLLAYKDGNIIIYQLDNPLTIDYKYKNKIIFNALDGRFNDGDNIKEILTDNEEIIFPSDPLKDGYIFSGWYDENDYKIIDNNFKNDQELKAGFDLNTYDITFDFNKITDNIYEKIGANHRLSKINVPSVEGYAFIGFYSDKEYLHPYDFSKSINNDLIIYGKYEKVVSITFHNIDNIYSSSFEAAVGDKGLIDEKNNKIVFFGPFKKESGLSFVINNLEGSIRNIEIKKGKRTIKINQDEYNSGNALYVGKWFFKRKSENKNNLLKIIHNLKANKDEAFTLTLYNLKEDIDIYVNYMDVKVNYIINDNEYETTVPYESLLEIEAPEIDNGVFEGWYLDKEYQEAFLLDKPVLKDITIYGKYDLFHTISFNERVNMIASSKWEEETGGQIDGTKAILVGDYNNTNGVAMNFYTDVIRMSAIEIEYGGLKTTIKKEDLFGTHFLNTNFDFVEKSKYENGDILKTYLDQNADSQISIRFFNIKDDMKINIIY